MTLEIYIQAISKMLTGLVIYSSIGIAIPVGVFTISKLIRNL